jgi:hypothetical protein
VIAGIERGGQHGLLDFLHDRDDLLERVLQESYLLVTGGGYRCVLARRQGREVRRVDLDNWLLLPAATTTTNTLGATSAVTTLNFFVVSTVCVTTFVTSRRMWALKYAKLVKV